MWLTYAVSFIGGTFIQLWDKQGDFDFVPKLAYVNPMNMIKKLALAAIVSAISLPAIACDMHGSNGAFWTPMNHWQNFSPKASTIDPAFLGDKASSVLDDTPASFEASPPPPPRQVRPTFSSSADRAARAAKTRVIMMRQTNAADDMVTPETPVKATATISAVTASKTDAQPIR